MCDACVIDEVKRRMISRRGLFRGGAASLAAGALVGPAAAQGGGAVVDMTHTLAPHFPTFDGAPGISAEQTFAFAKDGYNLHVLTINEHTGTHIDAPLHFSEDGMSVDRIPVETLVAPLAVVDIRDKASSDPDARVTPEDLTAWIEAHGEIPQGAVVAMNSGWQEKLGTPAFRGADADGVLHFPGFHPDAAQMLLEQTGAVAIAVDTLSLDHGPSADFATHYLWLPAGRYGIENLAGLDLVPAVGATLVVGAPKHQGGTGGPARILALT